MSAAPTPVPDGDTARQGGTGGDDPVVAGDSGRLLGQFRRLGQFRQFRQFRRSWRRPVPRSRPGRLFVLTASTLVTATLVTAAVAALAVRSGGAAAERSGFTTAEVAVRDLSRTETLSGVVAYRDMRPLTPAASGVVTALPAVGDDLSSGDVLMRVDDRPVVLLAGPVPQWRELRHGIADGPDVHELEAALLALGHGTASPTYPDGHFDGATTDAVRAFQAAEGAVVDGIIGLGEVVFTAGDIHVAKLDVALGAPADPGEAVMTVQSTSRVVIVDLDPLDRDLVTAGTPAEVEMPGGERTEGVIESVSTTLEMNAENKGVYKVSIALTDPDAARGLQLAPVTVRYTTVVATHALSVPVTAVIGIPGGGHAVDVRDARGTVTRVPVELGAWGDGFVQVTGDLAEGAFVEVPA